MKIAPARPAGTGCRLAVTSKESLIPHLRLAAVNDQPEQVPASGLSWSEICHLNDSH